MPAASAPKLRRSCAAIAEERERLLEDRRRAVEARDQFLAVAAHELRTPIATLALLVDHLIATLLRGRRLAADAALRSS